MKTFITFARTGRFNDDDGKPVTFAHAFVLHHENKNEENERGQIPIKMKTTPQLVRSLVNLPAFYECEFMPSTKGSELVSATLIK